MARSDTDLTEGIERDALDSSVPIADALRKCVALGGRAGSSALREWAQQELQGYKVPTDETPDYRKVRAVIMVDGFSGGYQVKNQQISASTLPDIIRDKVKEEVVFRGGIGEIEALLSDGPADEPIRIGLPGGAELVRIMNATTVPDGTSIERIYWAPAAASVRGLLDQVRTNLTVLAAELRATMSTDQEVPSAQQADQAVSVVVTGRRSSVNVTSAQASGCSSSSIAPVEADSSPFWTRSRKIGAAVVGLATITSAVIAVITL
ncbi:MAG: hypothetical protein ACR2NB_11515 [Solirubrobacteraceae bacterium]